MLVAPQLVFVELQKTGGTHIHHLLADLFAGRSAGKHNVPTPSIIDSTIPILGSVRNPWSWYVSLWTYGCRGAGEISQRMRSPKAWDNVTYRGVLPGETPEQDAIYRRASPQRAREFYYADANNEEAFREWITVLLSPHFRKMVEPAFGRTTAADVAGAMTYRYFKLFVRDGDNLGARVKTLEDLKRMDEEHCFANALVRNERLEQDFIDAMSGFGCPLDEQQRELVLGRGKTNTSPRPKSTRDYYDAATAQVVAAREQFMIQKFGYVSPLDATAKQSFGPLVVTMRHKEPYDGSPQRLLLAKDLAQKVRYAERSLATADGARAARRASCKGSAASSTVDTDNPRKAMKAARKAAKLAAAASTTAAHAGANTKSELSPEQLARRKQRRTERRTTRLVEKLTRQAAT